jgi:3-phosphoshikimate 1-carboxyvinyltransferase
LTLVAGSISTIYNYIGRENSRDFFKRSQEGIIITGKRKFRVKPSQLSGGIDIPGSKSHTIRALAFSLLADGESLIEYPLISSDTGSCLEMIAQFGAQVREEENLWRVIGTGGNVRVPDTVIDVGNSGTTLYIGIGIASLAEGYTIFTGDQQIRNRPADSLLSSIGELGGEAFSTRNNGKPPLVIGGRIAGGKTSIEAVTSQYLTSLLIATPLAAGDTAIDVPLLNEAPYVYMTLGWLDKLGIEYKNDNLKKIFIRGDQRYRAFREYIPADFSSATFFLVSAAITASEITLRGLDFNDTQGDKEVVTVLREMGAAVDIGEKEIRIRGNRLRGGIFDLNAIPDALPALAVAACCAEGETRLVNVPQARLKETDRIRVMRTELEKMGAAVEELPDGMIIRGGGLRGARVHGHGDHRVVMALSVAGLRADGETVIDTTEAVSVTFPNFMELMASLGTDITIIEE